MSESFLDVEYSIDVARYLSFRIEFVEDAVLPAWKGNLIRGAIGSKLAKICGFKKINCGSCGIWSQCPFGYLYRARSKGIVLKKLMGVSKPFVLKPPLDNRRFYRAGDRMEFSIILFGDSIRFEKDVILSVIELGRSGLGFREARGRFRVLEIVVKNPYRDLETILYRDGTFYNSDTLIKYGDLVEKAREIAKYSGLRIRFLTPYRIVSLNTSNPALDLETIVKYASRRFAIIMAQYMYRLPKYNIHDVLEKARKAELIDMEVKRVEIKYRGTPEEYYIGEQVFHGGFDETITTILVFPN